MVQNTLGKTPEKGRRKSRPGRDDGRERARIRDHLQAGMGDPDRFLDLDQKRKNTRRLLASGRKERRELLESQKEKVKAELRNIRDLDAFLRKTSRSKTLYALVAMAFFRHARDSQDLPEGNRFKRAIGAAMDEPGLSKAIRSKWDVFDEEFPGRAARQFV